MCTLQEEPDSEVCGSVDRLDTRRVSEAKIKRNVVAITLRVFYF